MKLKLVKLRDVHRSPILVIYCIYLSYLSYLSYYLSSYIELIIFSFFTNRQVHYLYFTYSACVKPKALKLVKLVKYLLYSGTRELLRTSKYLSDFNKFKSVPIFMLQNDTIRA